MPLIPTKLHHKPLCVGVRVGTRFKQGHSLHYAKLYITRFISSASKVSLSWLSPFSSHIYPLVVMAWQDSRPPTAYSTAHLQEEWRASSPPPRQEDHIRLHQDVQDAYNKTDDRLASLAVDLKEFNRDMMSSFDEIKSMISSRRRHSSSSHGSSHRHKANGALGHEKAHPHHDDWRARSPPPRQEALPQHHTYEQASSRSTLRASTTTSTKGAHSIFGGTSRAKAEHVVLPPTMEAHGVEYGDECTDVPHTPIYDEIHHIPCESETHPPHLSESENMSELCATTTNESECISIERMSVTTTSPIYDEIPQFPREESHHYHLSDSTICEFESIHLEGVSEPPHMMSGDVDRSCEANKFSNNLSSNSIVSSPLVLGLPYDDAHIFDEYPPSHGGDDGHQGK